ncbi:hypothetical protein RirG_195850 [Rhizophagus irregularis DAOM 197198w]|uniref:Uncharacterized protein n=1 Tax=Rhizophagus irregularis (strain DAOM 197198w) TaxID=1432141 RepID=A0A015IWJ1_RHIIW|nr:hypothetical protein RirG_195850 [Rhizophagus irregularis DAOM 197198w]
MKLYLHIYIFLVFLYNSSGDNNYEDYESGSENENEEQVLSIGKEFDSWEEVNRFFDEYALSKGFAIRKCRGDYISLEDSSQRLVRRTYSCTFSEIKADIKFYMTYGGPSIGAKIIRNLLQAKYPQQYIHPKTLYNSIQECKPLTPTVLQHDATNLLNLLREYQIKNPEWYYQARFDKTDGRLTSIFWMSPTQKQLWL